MKSLKKVLAILISAVLMVTAMSVCAFADQYSDAKALNNKKTVSESIKRDVTKLYKVTTASDGEISLDWSTSMEWFEIRVIDEDGVSQKVSRCDVKASSLLAGGENDNFIDCVYDKDSQKFTASAAFTVKKGTYYVKIWTPRAYGLGLNTEEGTYKLTATYPSKTAEKEFSYLGITLKKGSTMQLEAVDADKGNISWSSSKKSIVTVSSTGKLTAKKKGTAIITCKSGDVTVKLKVVVK